MPTVINGSSNINFDATTGGRITGDFSNATIANRVAFQTSTVNGATVVSALPNGTATNGQLRAYNNSDPTNSATAALTAQAGFISLQSTVEGTGTFLPMTFFTGGSERVRIDTSGNVGIGTSSPTFAKLDIRAGTTAGIIRAANDYGTAFIECPSGGPNRITSLNASITASQAFAFNGAGGAEWMRIDSSGNLLVGTTSALAKLTVQTSQSGGWTGATFKNLTGSVDVSIDAVTGGNAAFVIKESGTTRWTFWNDNANSNRLNITDSDFTHGVSLTQNSNSWASYSDRRLKDAVTPVQGGLSVVSQLQAVTYQWKSNSAPDVGFIAQQVQQAVPLAVVGNEEDFYVDEDGRARCAMSVMHDKLLPYMVAAIQEQQAIITALTARVEALEGAQA